jgi:hypothetical protein
MPSRAFHAHLFAEILYLENTTLKRIDTPRLCCYTPVRAEKRDLSGGLAEWLMAAVLKTAIGASLSRVRIPHPPPCYLLVLLALEARRDG